MHVTEQIITYQNCLSEATINLRKYLRILTKMTQCPAEFNRVIRTFFHKLMQTVADPGFPVRRSTCQNF